jgi:excisionase family DNA binding protein
LGELLIARLHLALLARLNQAKSERHAVYVSIDESQRFAGASLPILLSEGRKLGLGLILSTQFLDAWGDELSASVLGNVGTLVAFRCGPDDARRLRASMRPFTPENLEDLDRMFLTAEQVGQELGLKKSRIYELAAAGLLPVVRLGRKMLFPRRGLDMLVEAAIERVNARLDLEAK